MKSRLPITDAPVVAITGAAGTLGWSTASLLAAEGCELILLTRRPEDGQLCQDRLLQQFPHVRVSNYACDLARLADVRHCAQMICGRHKHIDVLINNAGIMAVPHYTLTGDGVESHFGINYLSHFVLTASLLPILLGSSSPRVLLLSSLAAHLGRPYGLHPPSPASYNPWLAYSDSKLAMLMFALELANRYRHTSLETFAISPGIVRSGLQRYVRNTIMRAMVDLSLRVLGQAAPQGSETTIAAVLSETFNSGDYIVPDGVLGLRGRPSRGRLPNAAASAANRQTLWAMSESVGEVTFK